MDARFALPEGLPVPQDDGAADHLRVGPPVADLELPSTSGYHVNLARLDGRTVLFIYPRTGEPGKPAPENWDLIPGARGCTPQTCSFRDLHADLRKAGAAHVFGLSTQTAEYQREVADRLHLPFAILSDREEEESAERPGKFGQAMNLPWFEYGGKRLYKRMALVLKEGKVEQVFYPVFPPDRNAGDVLAWLKANAVQSQ